MITTILLLCFVENTPAGWCFQLTYEKYSSVGSIIPLTTLEEKNNLSETTKPPPYQTLGGKGGDLPISTGQPDRRPSQMRFGPEPRGTVGLMLGSDARRPSSLQSEGHFLFSGGGWGFGFGSGLLGVLGFWMVLGV